MSRCCRGPQGSPGPSGPRGPAGSAGSTGPAGPAGSTGPVGSTGAVGVLGAGGDFDWFRHAGVLPYERWYAAGTADATALSSSSFPIDTLLAAPFVSRRGGAIDKISIRDQGSDVGSVARIGIYENTSDTVIYPTDLVFESAEIDQSSGGVKTQALAVVLEPNVLYWFVHLGGAIEAFLRSIGTSSRFGVMGTDPTFPSAYSSALIVAQAYGPLPAVFPAGALPTTAFVPVIAVHFV